MPGEVLLIVDDDPDMREALGEVLAAEGYRVATARDGREALTILASVRPAVILLDLMMPGMDGWTFRAAQRADARLATIPVVLLSASTSLARNARDLDVAAWLGKPLRMEELLALLRSLAG